MTTSTMVSLYDSETSRPLGLAHPDGGVLESDLEQRKSCGLCCRCGETRTHVRVKTGLRLTSKLKPITSENRDGTYEIYKGYCLGPCCFRLEEVKQILQEPIPRKKSPLKLKTSRYLKKDKRKEDVAKDSHSISTEESEGTEDTAPMEEDEELPKRSKDLSLIITDSGRAQVRTGKNMNRSRDDDILEMMSQEPAFRGKQVTIHMAYSQDEIDEEEENGPYMVLNEYGEIQSTDSSHAFGSGQSGIFTIQEEDEAAPPLTDIVTTPTKTEEELDDDEFDKQMEALVASRPRANVFDSPTKNKWRAAIRPAVPTSAGRHKVLSIKSPQPEADDLEERAFSPRAFRDFAAEHHHEGTISPVRRTRLQYRDEQPPTLERPIAHGRETLSADKAATRAAAAAVAAVVTPSAADLSDSHEETVVGRSLDESNETAFSSVEFAPEALDDDKSSISAAEKEEPFDADESNVESEASEDVVAEDCPPIFRQYSTTSPNGSMDLDEAKEASPEKSSSFRRYATTSLSFEEKAQGEKSNEESYDSSSSFPRYATTLHLENESDEEDIAGSKCAATPATKSTLPVDLDESNPTSESSASFPRYAPVSPARKSRSGPVDLDELDDDDFSEEDSQEGVTSGKQVSGPVDLDELDDCKMLPPTVVANGTRRQGAMPKGKNPRTFGTKEGAMAAAPVALVLSQSRSPAMSARQVTTTRITASVMKQSKHTKTGIAFKRSNGSCLISKLVKGGLFFGTSLAVGDKIVSINNVDCRGKEIKFVANLVRVSKGTITVVAVRNDESEEVPTQVTSPTLSRSSRKTSRSSNTKNTQGVQSEDNASVVSDISGMTDTFGAVASVASPRNSMHKVTSRSSRSHNFDENGSVSNASVSSSFTTTTARPHDTSFASCGSSSQAYPSEQDESYYHAMKSGVLWLTLVGQHVRFPKTWFQGARAPHMGVSNLLTKQGQKEPQHRWAYIARDVFHSEPLLNQYVPNKLSPGRLLMHIVIRDESWKPVQDVAIGLYHPYSKALTAEKGEDSRVLWMAIRRRSGHRVGSTALIDPVLASECRIQDIMMESPLGRGRRVQNKNLLAIFGDQPPVQTVFILETELVKKVRACREREYITDFKPITLLLLELFLQSKVEL